MRNRILTRNTLKDNYGWDGAVAAGLASAKVTMSDNIISDNLLDGDNGFPSLLSTGAASIELTGNRVSGNSCFSRDDSGRCFGQGMVFACPGVCNGTMTLSGNTIEGNFFGESAISADGHKSMALNGNIVNGNLGGISLYASEIDLVNNVVAGNSGSENGTDFAWGCSASREQSERRE